MVFNVAYGQLPYAIGGMFSMSTWPLYPAWRGVPEEEYSYFGTDQRHFIFTGSKDNLFEPAADGIQEVHDVFTSLSKSPVIEYSVVAEGVKHVEDCRYFAVMMHYVNSGNVSSIDDYPKCKMVWSFDAPPTLLV